MTDENVRRAERQAARLRRALRERDARLYELESRLEALETSTSYQMARALASAGKQKARGAVQLPGQLYRLWKKRATPNANVKLRDRPRLEGFERPEERLLVGEPYEGLIVAGILAPATAALLREKVKLVELLPHAAAPVLDAADVDVVLVDGAAGEPGGPWAYLGVPGMYDRERTLLDVREVAKVRGLPLVLWSEAAPPPTLTRLDWDTVSTEPLPAAIAALTARYAGLES